MFFFIGGCFLAIGQNSRAKDSILINNHKLDKNSTINKPINNSGHFVIQANKSESESSNEVIIKNVPRRLNETLIAKPTEIADTSRPIFNKPRLVNSPQK